MDCTVILCLVLQTWIHTLVLVLSAGSYFAFVLLFNCVMCSPPTNPVGVETLQMSQPLFYIICAVTTVTALLPRYNTTTHPDINLPTHTSLPPGVWNMPQLTGCVFSVFRTSASHARAHAVAHMDILIAESILRILYLGGDIFPYVASFTFQMGQSSMGNSRRDNPRGNQGRTCTKKRHTECAALQCRFGCECAKGATFEQPPMHTHRL